MGSKLQDKLSEIHNWVKTRFIYVPDKDRYGVVEYWARPDESLCSDGMIRGDCEDFAIWCKTKCEEKGITTGRLVACNMIPGDKNTHHCVLEVQGWILGNNLDCVWARDDIDYEWLKIKYKGDWYKIQ